MSDITDWGYSTRDVAKLAKLSERRIRAYAKAGIVGGDARLPAASEPAKRSDMAGKLRRCRIRFSFGDLLVLRTAGRLLGQGVAPRRVERALTALSTQLDDSEPLTGVNLHVTSGRVVASDGTVLWEPESGQCVLRFDAPGDQGEIPKPVNGPGQRALPPGGDRVVVHGGAEAPSSAPFVDVWQRDGDGEEDAADYWFDLALEQEDGDPEKAHDAYLRALAANPEHVEATINLGRLCAADGDSRRAAAYFRQATRIAPKHPVAHFNLGVTLQDLDDPEGAAAAYETVLEHDPRFADAHYNLAMLFEQRGDREAALRHLQACRALATAPQA